MTDGCVDSLRPRDWVVSLLRCPTCHQVGLMGRMAAVECPACGARFAVSDGLIDLLVQPHPVVARERSTVLRLSGEDESVKERYGELLRRLDAGGLGQEELAEFPSLEHVSRSRAQIRQVLRHYPLCAGELVVELGADHCSATGLLLDAGCRVIATDITDHLKLAPRANDPSLCRIVADMNDLPVAPGCADVVWATAAVHHSWSIERTFAEAARVLRPGGRLYFCCEPLPSWLRHPFGRSFGHAERALGINETWLPRRAWLRAAVRAGFAPRVVSPELDRQALEERLEARHLPRVLAPLARPFLRMLQVSVHLLATKVRAGGPAASAQ